MSARDWLVKLIGRPAERSALVNEQAGPTAHFVRNPYSSQVAPGLTPQKLAAILRESITGSPERYLALAEDMEERFAHYSAVLATRKRQVARLPITVEAASDDPKDIAEAELVRRVVNGPAFRLAKIDMLDAIGKGFSATEMVWATQSQVWMPTKFVWRDPRFFEFGQTDPDQIMLRGDSGLEELKPAGWIVHRAKAKSGLTIRGGLALQVAWPFLFQSFNLKDWAIFCEAYGQPVRIGKFDQGASEADKRVLFQAIQSIGVDFAAIIPAAMQVEFLKADIGSSTDLYERRANWIDQQVSKIVLGQTGTTDVIEGGGYASSKVHDDVRSDIRDADAEQLAASLNEQLVTPLVMFNFADRERKGLPTIKIGGPAPEDLTAMVDRLVKLVPLGMQVDMADVRRKLGLMAPEPGAKVLGVSASIDHRGYPVTAALYRGSPWADDYADIINSQGWERADDAGSTGHTSRTIP